jgi:hypothetical protein
MGAPSNVPREMGPEGGKGKPDGTGSAGKTDGKGGKDGTDGAQGDDTDSTEANVRQLAHTIRNIRTNFFTESQTLQGFDIMRFKGHDGNVLVLRPSWDALRKVRTWLFIRSAMCSHLDALSAI